MTRNALAIVTLVLALAAFAAEAGAAALKPLPTLNGVRCLISRKPWHRFKRSASQWTDPYISASPPVTLASQKRPGVRQHFAFMPGSCGCRHSAVAIGRGGTSIGERR